MTARSCSTSVGSGAEKFETPAFTDSWLGCASDPDTSKTQWAAVRMCEASTIEPEHRYLVEPACCWTKTAHGADWIWITVPPITAEEEEALPAATPAERATAMSAPHICAPLGRLGATKRP